MLKLNSILNLFTTLAFLLYISTPAMSANKPTKLALGDREFNEIKSGETHSYQIELADGQFILGKAMQISVDVKVAIFDPNGKSIAEFDGPFVGNEYFQFNTESNGVYKINVTPFEKSAGKYYIIVFRAEPVAKTNEGKINQMMTSRYHNDSAGGVIAVVRKGKIDFSAGYGLANVEYNIPNTISTPYHVASLAKQFTAFAITLLAKQKKLDLGDDVRKHLPDFPKFEQAITLRHLLNHTSGLRDHWDLWMIAGGLMGDVIRQQDLMALIKRQRALNFSPGDEFMYSNTGYLLLSEVVSAITKQPFRTWMQENVFQPLNMNSTLIYDNYEAIVKNRAYSYYSSDQGLSKSVLNFGNTGATSLFTTVEDLAKWLDNFRSHKVGGKKVIKQLQQQGILNNGYKNKYALGIYVEEHNGLRMLYHDGVDAGFRTGLAYYPEIDSGIIVLGNTASFDAHLIGKATAETFFGKHMKTKAKAKKENTQTPATPAHLGKAYIGSYRIKNGAIVNIKFNDGKLSSSTQGQPARPLTPIDDYTFRVGNIEATVKIKFLVEPDGSVNKATIYYNGPKTMQRVEPWAPNIAELKTYNGRYYSEELETVYTVSNHGDKSIITHRRHGDIHLLSAEKNNFRTEKHYLNKIEFTDNKDGLFQTMKVSSHRVRNLTFKRIE